MSSTYSYTVSPASLHGHPDDSNKSDFHQADPLGQGYDHSAASSQLLSPYSSYTQSNSASPTANQNTPAESTSTLSAYPSDFASDIDLEDPFFGVDFNDTESGAPSFLEDGISTQPGAHQNTRQAPAGLPFYGQADSPSPQVPYSIETYTSAPQLTPDSNGGE